MITMHFMTFIHEYKQRTLSYILAVINGLNRFYRGKQTEVFLHFTLLHPQTSPQRYNTSTVYPPSVHLLSCPNETVMNQVGLSSVFMNSSKNTRRVHL